MDPEARQVYRARDNIISDGEVAFYAGEEIEVERVLTDPDTFEEQYRVFAPRLQYYTVVSEKQVATLGEAVTRSPIIHPASRRSATIFSHRSLYLIVTVAVIGACFYLFMYISGRQATSSADAIVCRCNLETITLAISRYHVETGHWPGPGRADILVPEYIQHVPVCPTSGSQYRIPAPRLEVVSPVVECPTHEDGHY